MTNLSKEKREQLLGYLKELKQLHTDDFHIRKINELEQALKEKRYGLVWEKHKENIDEMLENNIAIFTENEERKIEVNKDKPYNFLIEGDNLHSLKLLEKTHRGKIDVIYIDPPYNTGNKDFRYNDNYVDKTDGYYHSKWLSFMERRLTIAKDLLTEDGVIFISIDDNEQAQLKLLCDSIFGEDKFVATIHCQLSTTQGMKVKSAQNGNIVKNAEYILVYNKSGKNNIASNPLYDIRNDYDEHYNQIITENGEIISLKQFYNYAFPGDLNNKKALKLKDAFIKSEEFAEVVRSNLKNIVRTHLAEIVLDDKETGYNIKSDLSIGKYRKFMRDGKEYLLTLNSNNKVQQLLRLSDSWGETDSYKNPEGLRKIRGDWWEGFYLDMGNVSKEGNIEFKNGKKPIRLIGQIIKMIGNKELTILDFFAGSGTTGHAVAQLNKEDGGNRKYILCTNNENNICEEVTYQRLKNIQTELPHNLKYLKANFIPKDSDKETISNYIKELIELENHMEIDNKNNAIVFEEEDILPTLKGMVNGGKIFISYAAFLSSEEYDIADKKNIQIIEIPEYYYRKELKEIGEI